MKRKTIAEMTLFPSGRIRCAGTDRVLVSGNFCRRAARGFLRSLPTAFAACVLSLSSCGGAGGGSQGEGRSAASGMSGVPPTLEVPAPPSVLRGDSLRMSWLAAHYWDNLDWTDPRWTTDTSALEEAFAPWAQLLSLLPAREAAGYAGALFRAGDPYPGMQLRLLKTAEYFWRHPNSPYRNEEFYIPVLEAVTEAPGIDSLRKVRPLAQLASARKNRPGTPAADITYVAGNGERGTLYGQRAEYLLLMFYDPGCSECARIEAYIPQSGVFAPLVASGRLKVLAIYPDEEVGAWREHLPRMPAGWTVGRCFMDKAGGAAYDLPGIPALYLLDRDKTVLVKDRPMDEIEAWLERNAAEE